MMSEYAQPYGIGSVRSQDVTRQSQELVLHGEWEGYDRAKIIPEDVARRLGIVPLELRAGTFLLGSLEPLGAASQHELELFTGCSVDFQVVNRDEFNSRFEQCYQGGVRSVEEVIHDLNASSNLELLADNTGDDEASAYRLENLANDAPIIQLVNAILIEAVHRRATDVHIEPTDAGMRVRYRIDGVLYDVPPPPKQVYLGVVSRIKIMAGADIAEKRLPQDGRIRVKLQGKEIDIRVSTIPVLHGESVVLRLLDSSNLLLDLEELGFSEPVERAFRSIIKRTHGIILVTGPTGCGKTTTLYAALTALNGPEKKIITIEDPVEYELPGINQVPVRPKIDFGFANGLRSILRQDPDIIMVGEIRDLETAIIAVQAALTGHLVFSTVHTNDAASTVTRLLDMGIEPYLVASSIRAILAQRLVRVLCPFCRKPVPRNQLGWTSAESGMPGETPLSLPDFVYVPVGCQACDGLGFKGRTGVYELLVVDEEIERQILMHSPARGIREHAVSQGMATLLAEGLAKVSTGVTSLDEVLRIVHE